MSADTDMVERVARVLCNRRKPKPAEGQGDAYDLLCSWSLAGDLDADVELRDFDLDAVAVISAMRNPTKRMRRAACAAMSPGKRPTEEWVSDRAKHAIRWRAMIDEALRSSSLTPTNQGNEEEV